VKIALLACSVALLAGCGGEGASVEEEPVVPPEPLGEQAVREVIRIRAAGVEAGELSGRIFAVVAAAGQQPRAAADDTLRAQLPPLLEAAAVVWPRSYRAVAAEAPSSEVGRRQRAILLTAVRSEQASLALLRRELELGDSAWPAVTRFGSRSDALRKRLRQDVDAMMAAIPTHEREALQRAVAESN